MPVGCHSLNHPMRQEAVGVGISPGRGAGNNNHSERPRLGVDPWLRIFRTVLYLGRRRGSSCEGHAAGSQFDEPPHDEVVWRIQWAARWREKQRVIRGLYGAVHVLG